MLPILESKMRSILLTIFMLITPLAQADILACDDNVITDQSCSGKTIHKRASTISETKKIYVCSNNVFTDIPCPEGKIFKLRPEPSKQTQKLAYETLQNSLKLDKEKRLEEQAKREHAYQLTLLERVVTALEVNAHQSFQTNQVQLPRRLRYTDQRIYNVFY